MPLDIDKQPLIAKKNAIRPIVIANDAPTPISYKKFRHIPGLDNIRGFAVLFVLLLHVSYGFIKGGWLGVEIFFVLSGFLITSILQTEYRHFGKISIRRFYIRRAVRLFPPLLIAVISANILWSYNSSLYPSANRSLATLGSLLYFVNLLPEKISGVLVHLWSLAVEEHFYLLWPFLASYIFKFSRKRQVSILVILILSVSVYRILQGGFDLQFDGSIFIIDPARFTFCSIDGILIGALMAILLSKPLLNDLRISGKYSNILIAVMCTVVTYMLFKLSSNSFYFNGGFILLDLFCAATIYLAIKNPAHYLFSNRTIKWMGTRSYGIYVYHYIIFISLEHFRHQGNNGNLVLISIVRIGISLLVAEISFRYMERPFSRSKLVSKLKHLFPPLQTSKQPS